MISAGQYGRLMAKEKKLKKINKIELVQHMYTDPLSYFLWI